MSKMTCPICHGKGGLTEDPAEYTFVTRDPQTNRCLFCNGSGHVGARKKLPDGRSAYEMPRTEPEAPASAHPHPEPEAPASAPQPSNPKTTLNVSKKAAIHPSLPDTGIGYHHHPSTPKPLLLEMALNPRLNKALASGKNFLIITETEPYYMMAYRLIRIQEKIQGTWSERDEEDYIEALEKISEAYYFLKKEATHG